MLLARFAERRIEEGLRVAGVIEEPAGGVDCGVCDSLILRDTAGSTIIPITQNLGPGSSACKLVPLGLPRAARVVAAIEQGADVVVLSKYGKIEAEGGGLLDAFRTAAVAGVPCVTGVKPAFAEPSSNTPAVTRNGSSRTTPRSNAGGPAATRGERALRGRPSPCLASINTAKAVANAAHTVATLRIIL